MKNKLQILIVIVLAFALIAAAGINLTRLRVKNISNHEISVWLEPVEEGKGIFYYFFLEEGTQVNPTEKVYTVIPAVYDFRMQINGLTISNPFCLPAADIDKMEAGVQIEISKSKKTMIFEECISYQDVPNQYDKFTGFWKDFDGLWRVLFRYEVD